MRSLGKCFSTIHLPIQWGIGEFDSLPHLVEICCLEVLADCAKSTSSAWIWRQELGPISFCSAWIALLRLEIRFSMTSHRWQRDSVQVLLGRVYMWANNLALYSPFKRESCRATRQVKHKRVSHIFSGHNSRNIAHIDFKFVLITRDSLLPDISSFISIKSTFSTSRNCRNSFKFCKMCKILVSKTHFMKNIGFLLGWNTLYYILKRYT